MDNSDKREGGAPPSLTGLLATSEELLREVWSLRQRLESPDFAQYQRLVAAYPEVSFRAAREADARR